MTAQGHQGTALYSAPAPTRLAGEAATKERSRARQDRPVHRNLQAFLTSTRRARRADIPSTQAHLPDVWERAPAAEAPKELGSHSSLGLAR